jgi:hypothetical protein
LWSPSQPSGNRAFDEYREETFRRLEEEQRELYEFLGRLRIMAECRTRTGPSSPPQG